MNSVRTRFPPSPTGFLHIGGLRTALFCYLFAKQRNGTFVLRIEDTDRERFVEGGVENILRSLEWAGIPPDEGVMLADHKIIQKGDDGPYIQSERLPIYTKHAERLTANGHVYYCFCSKERLDSLREIQQKNKQPTGYDRHCRNLSEQEVQNKLRQQTPHVIRMKMPKNGETEFTDLIRERVSFKNELLDDQILIKADGYPTYHLANVVDDHLMHITHVIRGEEWLSSTPKHVILYQMFGWEPPRFAHLPLLVNEKKAKLSKRHGDVSVEDFKEKGYLPEALVNFVAFLGWNPGNEREMFSLYELEQEFSLDKVSKAAAVFNREKLNWYNKQYMMNMDLEELTNRAAPFFIHAGVLQGDDMDDREMFERLMQAVDLERSRVHTLSELVQAVGFVFADELVYEAELLIWKKANASDAKEKLIELSEYLHTINEADWNQETLESRITDWIQNHGYGTGNVLWPMRVALSGQKNSPGPFEISAVLGKEKTMKRIKHGIAKLG